jgi:SAM-dependent methyltransferase
MSSRRMILAPYAATPPEVVARMLGLAGVCEADVVYDLGCGDGRICIAAAKEFGARAVGIDVEPYWVEQARANAEVAGVSGLATFHVGDACDWELGDATVITLYLVGWSTRAMAREMSARARVGTRVVSHSYRSGGRGTETLEEVVDAKGGRRRIFLWSVGTDVDPVADARP